MLSRKVLVLVLFTSLCPCPRTTNPCPCRRVLISPCQQHRYRHDSDNAPFWPSRHTANFKTVPRNFKIREILWSPLLHKNVLLSFVQSRGARTYRRSIPVPSRRHSVHSDCMALRLSATAVKCEMRPRISPLGRLQSYLLVNVSSADAG